MGEKYVTDSYITAVERIFWGYFFIYFNLNLGPIDIFPGWGGYLFLLYALPGIAELEPSAKLLKPFTYILIAWDVFNVILGLMGSTDVLLQLYGLSAAMSVVGLYFHFQLLTNLAQIAKRQNNTRDKTFLWLRNGQTILQTLTAMVPLFGGIAWEYAGLNLIVALAALLAVGLMIAIMVNLHRYKNELVNMNETGINSPRL